MVSADTGDGVLDVVFSHALAGYLMETAAGGNLSVVRLQKQGVLEQL